ncbi:hypothetical protein TUM12147_43780 [Citrobacter europaeus]|nr:hypothetical protein TUM12147_43780 [Citrobacter europaeus]GIZ22102.1 hypothetical protein TUM12148_07660 [Citrobacter europaeus]
MSHNADNGIIDTSVDITIVKNEIVRDFAQLRNRARVIKYDRMA